MTARRSPEAWFWSYDIGADQIDSLLTPGMRLMRLSRYGGSDRRRFAALVYKEPGAERGYVLDLEAAALEARLRQTPARPVAITVDGGVPPRFSVVVEMGPGPMSDLRVDLDEGGVRALLDGQHGIADFATYLVAGVRRYAAIVQERVGASWFLTGLAAGGLGARLRELDAAPVRLREYSENGRLELAAVAEPARAGDWTWHAGVDAGGVAGRLDASEAYPVDLDARRDGRALRFTVIIRR